MAILTTLITPSWPAGCLNHQRTLYANVPLNVPKSPYFTIIVPLGQISKLTLMLVVTKNRTFSLKPAKTSLIETHQTPTTQTAQLPLPPTHALGAIISNHQHFASYAELHALSSLQKISSWSHTIQGSELILLFLNTVSFLACKDAATGIVLALFCR